MKGFIDLNSPKLHAVLYALLLIFTPFIMLQNYLQRSISELSHWKVNLLGIDIPVVFGVFALLCIVFAILYIRKLTFYRIVSLLVVFIMIVLGQNISDFYSSNDFYDLQNNWHYIAYGLFSFFFYRAYDRPLKNNGKFIFTTYLVAIGLSSFDETFQYFLSSRVFDLSDIAKDGWGIIMGLVAIFFFYDQGKNITKDGWKITRKSFRHYLKSGLSLLVFFAIFNFIFLIISSMHTAFHFVPFVILSSIITSVVLVLLIHFSQIKFFRIILLCLIALMIISTGISYLGNSDENLKFLNQNLVMYKGIPLCYFDILISPDDGFRFVDKKKFFTVQDRKALLRQQADILIVSSGTSGKGGQGISDAPVKFGYNPFLDDCTQIIVKKTPEACKLYNRLKDTGKKVAIVIHNSR